MTPPLLTLSELSQEQVPDQDETRHSDPDVWRPMTLEDELSAALDQTFIDDEDEDELEQLESPSRTHDPNHDTDAHTQVLTPTSQSPSSLLSPTALHTWHTTLTTLSALPATSTTLHAITRHASALHDWLVLAVTPYTAALERYRDAVVEDNERLGEKLDALRGEVDELVESYRREVEGTREVAMGWAEGVEMIRGVLGPVGEGQGHGAGYGHRGGDAKGNGNGNGNENSGERDEDAHSPGTIEG